MVERVEASVSPSITDYAQKTVPGSNPDLYQLYAVRGKLNPELNCKKLSFLFAGMAQSGERRQQSLSRKLLKSLVVASTLLSVFDPVIFLFLRDN